jgi:hypothetical protein
MRNTESEISPKTDDGQHGVTDPTKNTTQKAKEMSNTKSRTPPKTQHRNQKRWVTTRSHGPHQKHNTENKRDEQHGVTDPTKNTTQKTKEMSNTQSRTPPQTQHRKLKRWATWSHRSHQKPMIGNTESRTPPKTQHRKLKRWATRSHGPHQKYNTESKRDEQHGVTEHSYF